jgi:hypothetical protein
MMSRRNIIKPLGCCLILALGWSCHKAPLCDCFMAAGSPSSITRSVDNFNQITLNDDVNLFLAVGPQQIVIDGGKNLIQNIVTDVSGGMLTLKNNNICDWARSYKKSVINVYVTSPNINYILINGVGTVQSTDTITFDTLHVQTKSAGDINLTVKNKAFYASMFSSADLTVTGTSNIFECNFFAGTGFVYCDKLISGYTYMVNNSIGDCYITSTGEMDVTIFKEGNVYYAGNPSPIHLKTYGKGQLIKE